MSDEPRLLEGGNPQIPKGDGPEVVESYLAAMPGWKQDVGRWIHGVVTATVPDVRMAVRWNTPFYGLEDNGWFLGFHCLTNYVKVSFLNGSQLDPLPPETSKQPAVRYLHVHEDDERDDAPLAQWAQQAAALPGEPLF